MDYSFQKKYSTKIESVEGRGGAFLPREISSGRRTKNLGDTFPKRMVNNEWIIFAKELIQYIAEKLVFPEYISAGTYL